jgi:Ribbon-helix-helix protein, copG family
MPSFDDPKPPKEKRKQQLVYLLPSIRDAIDRQRAKLGQSRSEWLERAAKAWLKADKS